MVSITGTLGVHLASQGRTHEDHTRGYGHTVQHMMHFWMLGKLVPTH